MYESNFQTRRVLIVRFFLGKVDEDLERGSEDEEGKGGKEGIVGKVMLVDGEVKRNDGGKTRVLMVCKSEEERVKVFREHFGIELTQEEIRAVRGRIVELKHD